MILVVDANVWFDLDNAGLLSTVSQLEAELVVPDLLLPELETLTLPNSVRVHRSSSAELKAIVEFRRTSPQLTDVDAIALVVSHREHAVLVTGDAHLRKSAESSAVEVHGVLWVLDRLIGCGALTETLAADALRQMIDGGAHLPAQEVAQRLSAWGRRDPESDH